MTSIEAYKNLLLKVNKNDTNADIDISKGEFVALYNEQKDKWLDEKITDKESTDDILHLEKLEVKYLPLEKVHVKDIYTTFQLPDNFFVYISSYSVCSEGNCSGVIVRNYPIKPKNENTLLENANTDPSLEFEETVVDLSDSKLFVYKKDFEVDKVYLNYYRTVGAIDIEGYRRLDNTQSTNIDPDLSDFEVYQILDRCVKEVIRRYENPEGFQLAAERIQTES